MSTGSVSKSASELKKGYPIEDDGGGGGLRILLCQSLFSEPVFIDRVKSPGIDSKPGGPVRQPCLTYWPARLHRLAESIPRNRFLGSLNVYKFGLVLHARLGTAVGAGIFEQSMGARDRVGIGLSYRPARLHSLAVLGPWNRFLGS
jgi:hypothetical protein